MLENLKLSKQLIATMLDAGFHSPTEIQAKTISRIIGGQSIGGIAPEHTGKTTAYILTILMRLKGPQNGAPRALILVPTKDDIASVTAQFKWLAKGTGIRICGFTSGLQGEQDMESIEDGLADVVIGTPDKVNAQYVKTLLNLRSLIMFVVDKADISVKLNFHAAIYQITEGLNKAQRLVFSTTVNDKVEKLAEYLNIVELIESTEKAETNPETIPLILYKVSNPKTKLNLLELILRDSKTFTKAVVFVNTRDYAETLQVSLRKRLGKCAILNYDSYNNGIDSVETFKSSDERILVLCNEDQPSFNLLDIPYIFHMEYPDAKTFLNRTKKLSENSKAVAVTFATNPELDQIKKLEKHTGKTMEVKDLPSELIIEGKTKVDIDKEMPGKSAPNPKESKSKNEDWDWKVK